MILILQGNTMLKNIHDSDCCKLYLIDDNSKVEKIIATTPESRLICNDPFTVGIMYTRMLHSTIKFFEFF
jgi:hypothetical protein